ncbi:hypothetical protein [Tuwongella immobilis]|nr:hypothetical protein [Tuwongella immobilis]
MLNLGGIAVIFISLAVVDTFSEAPRTRALWAISQLMLGFVAMYGGQWWAYFQCRQRDAEVRATTALGVSLTIWRAALRGLPQTRWPVYVGFWGFVMVISAVGIIGIRE